MSKLKKYEYIYQLLKEQISASPPGTALMSVRDLMKYHQVSQVTVTRAFKQLQSEGLIETRTGHGTCCAGGSQQRNVLMLTSNYASSFALGVRRVFEEHFNSTLYKLKIASYDHDDINLNPALLGPGVDALIFSINQDFTSRILTQVSEVTIPIVFIDIMPQTLALDAVCTDNDLGGALVADWFLKRGHRQCAFLQSQPAFHSTVCRRRAFLRQLNLGGHEGKWIDCQTRSGENSTAKAYETFHRYLSENQLDFTALFCDTDLGALGVLKACHDFHIDVPGQLDLIGFDNIPEGEYFTPALSTIDQNIRQWAVATEHILTRRLAGETGTPIQTYVTPHLILRDSTRPPR